MILSKAQLVAVMPTTRATIDAWIDPLTEAMYANSNNNTQRAACFMATVAVESKELSRGREDLNYTSAMRLRSVFPTHFATDADAQPYVGDPRKTANLVYASRMGNGPPESGDGWKYRGGGLLGLTGRAMYAAYGADAQAACVEHPELLELPKYAADSAGWYFVQRSKDILVLADAGDFRGVTKAVNGGYIGWVDRKAYYDKFLGVM